MSVTQLGENVLFNFEILGENLNFVPMKSELEKLVGRYRELGIDRQLDYDKFYLYSIITHSTAIEGSTITELENQIMFDNGIALKGKSLVEQNMNLDLKVAYERALVFAREHADVTVELLKELSALTMKNTGSEYHTALGNFFICQRRYSPCECHSRSWWPILHGVQQSAAEVE